MAKDKIIIKGAKEHNLKNIDLEIPRDKLVVFTGLSGSGKSPRWRSIPSTPTDSAGMWRAFPPMPGSSWDRWKSPMWTISKAFPRRFPSTRKPLPRIPVPLWVPSPRSMTICVCCMPGSACRTVPVCGKEIEQQTVDQMVDQVLALPEGTRIQILAPVVRQRKGEHVKEFEAARRSGYVRVRVDGNLYDLSEEIKLEKNKKHTIEIVVDRLVVKEEIQFPSGRIRWKRPWASPADHCGGECHRRRGHHLLPEVRLPGARRQHRGAHPADVLLQ